MSLDGDGNVCAGLIVDRAYKGWSDGVKVGIWFCETMESLIWWGMWIYTYMWDGRDMNGKGRE